MERKYRIHDVAKELGLHENTIRRLEQRGLIQSERSLAGHRIFNEQALDQIRKIYRRHRRGLNK